jgi:hypothetical protein
VFVGKDLGGTLRAYDAGTGSNLANVPVPMGFTLASAPAVVDGTVILGAGAGERSRDPTDEGNLAAHIPQNVTALCAAGVPGCDPAPDDDCDAGGSAPGDARALAGARTAVETACPCVTFDGAHGRTHATYVHCMRRVLAAMVAEGQLRARCHRRSHHELADSTCGRPDTVVCCQTDPLARCLVVPPVACVSSNQRVRTSCPSATACATTTCLSTGVCAAGD